MTYNNSNGASAYREPNLSQATDEPDIPEIVKEMTKAADDSWDFYERNAHALDVRYCWWPGQTRDGRKHGTTSRAAFPWDGASDARVRLVDMVIDEQVNMLLRALEQMSIQAIPVKAIDADWANRMAALLRWYLLNQMADEADTEIELLANYMLTFGSAVLGVGWLQEMAYNMKTVKLDDLAQAATQAGQPQQFTSMMAKLFDPTQAEGMIEMFREGNPLLTKRDAKGVLEDLRNMGSATFPQPYIRESRPCLAALQVGQEVLFPANTRRLQRARWIGQRELLTEAELRERAEGPAQWDADFVEKVIETHKGQVFLDNWASAGVQQRMREIGSGWGSSWENDADEMFEVWHFYNRASHRGIPAIWHTVLHPRCPEYSATHEVLDYAHGNYPHVEFLRERKSPSILASRGIPEILNTEQDFVKVEYDSRRDRSSITTLPPVLRKKRTGGEQDRFGPAVVIDVNKMDDLSVMSWGGPDPTSIEVERSTRRAVNEMTGRPDAELDAQLSIDKRQALVARWMKRWQSAATQILQLAQQYTPPMTVARVLGSIPKPYDVSRENIAGQFQLMLKFDARYLNQEFVLSVLKVANEAILPLDTHATTDRNMLVRWSWSMIDPTLADMLVKDGEDASQSEISDEQGNIAKMFAGQAVPMKLKGEDHAARLQVIQDWLGSNPLLPQILKVRPDVEHLVKQRVDFLQQQVNQEQNKLIGIYGTQPVLAA